MSRDVKSFTIFAAAQARPLMKTALVLTGDFHSAQDLVQETLARMFETWHRVDSIDTPEAYIHVVMVRTYVSQRRRRSFWEWPLGMTSDGAAASDDPTLRIALVDALALLSAGDRAVLVLRFLLDRTAEDVAADLGKSAVAVRAQTKRALERLRSALGNDSLNDLARL